MPIPPSHSQPVAIASQGRERRGFARFHAVAAAALLCVSLSHHPEALALVFGRVVVQSKLGEPLRAEIEVSDISAEEASSLRAGLASADAFRSAGMELNQALSDVTVTLERRADGKPFLKLTGIRPVNDPFMDMVLEASWSSGRLMRDYTLLFDPSDQRTSPTQPLVAQVAPLPAPAAEPARPPVAAPTPAAAAAAPLPAPASAPSPVPSPAPAAAAAPAPAAPAPAAAPAAAAPVAASPAAAPAGNDSGTPRADGRIVVKAGDTASQLAVSNRPANVSLDQMLVAMLRANPEAFISGNVNRLKTGAVLDVPDEKAGTATPRPEARQIIAAQSRDFDEYRRRLAGQAPKTSVAQANRQATGSVQTEVKDNKATAPAQDKLTLSKGSEPGKTSAEDSIAKERQSKEASTRVAELSRNINDLSKIAPAGAPAAAPAASPAPASAGNAEVAAVPAPPAADPAPATAAPAAEPTAATPPAADAETDAPSSLMSRLTAHPWTVPLAGGLLALLAGLGIYRMRSQKKTSPADSSFLESRLQPDSFFGASGGQRIDTSESAPAGASMAYSPSQLDAGGDVDPVAEADVYLAYGRDLQAEEILKEAMRTAPTRVSIYSKLLEIYAKRRDAKAFEVVAAEVYGLTQGQGPEWEQACALGKDLDPANPAYQPGGAPALRPGQPGAVASALAGAASSQPFGGSTLIQPHSTAPTPLSNDLDLELDLSPPSQAPASSSDKLISSFDDLHETASLTGDAQAPAPDSSRPMRFDLEFPSAAQKDVASGTAPRTGRPPEPSFDLDLTAMSDKDSSSPPTQPSDLMGFDLNSIELDLDKTSGADRRHAGAAASVDDDGEGEPLSTENPLETKLSLAEEFRAIGDLEGARSLAEEVLAEAKGSLRNKASLFLADLA